MNVVSMTDLSEGRPLRANPVAFWAAYSAGRQAWSGLRLSYDEFLAHLVRLGCTETPAHPEGLYLCAACASGRDGAHQAIEAAYFTQLKGVVERVVGEGEAVSEILQEIRARLFVGPNPRIASFRGCGSLAGWLRRVAMHAARDYCRERSSERRRRRRLASEQDIAPAPALDADPVLCQFSEARCREVCCAAVLRLRMDERQLLFHHFVSGLSIDVLGPLYGVHRSTIARRIGRAIGRIRQQVRRTLAIHYRGLSADDLDTLAVQCCQGFGWSDALGLGDDEIGAQADAATAGRSVALASAKCG